MSIKLLMPLEGFIAETYEEYENRYMGFGKEFYSNIKNQLPHIYEKLSFYKRKNFQTVDSYAEFIDPNYYFAIQLDPLCEVIVLWNEKKQIEIGTWSSNKYQLAINYIKSELIP